MCPQRWPSPAAQTHEVLLPRAGTSKMVTQNSTYTYLYEVAAIDTMYMYSHTGTQFQSVNLGLPKRSVVHVSSHTHIILNSTSNFPSQLPID